MSEVVTINATVLYTRYYSKTWSSVVFRESAKPEHEFTAIGCLPELSPGQTIDLTGEWKIHEKYGEQLNVVPKKVRGASTMEETTSPDITSEEVERESDKEAILRVLNSSFIKGVRQTKASLIYDEFGEHSLGIIESQWRKLARIKGISVNLAESIHKEYMKNRPYIKLRKMLDSEATDGQIRKIYEMYGDKSEYQLKTDPYRLIDDIDGFGFKKADKVARAYGIKPDSPCRIRGAIMHILNEFATEGHCFAYPASILDHLAEYVGEIPNLPEVVADEIKGLKYEGRIVVDPDDGAVWPKCLYEAESYVASKIKTLCNAKRMKVPIPAENVELALLDVIDSTGFELEEHQRAAVEFVYQHPFTIITGGPGTGKTTIIKAILHVWRKFSSMEIVSLMAPTGKASRRITEVTGYPAYTIHQTSIAIARERMSLEDIGLVIVDEGSMIDINVAAMLMAMIDAGTRVVIIGDKDQLPSIGPGNFFWELCRASFIVPKFELKLSFRQHGSIATNAYRLNNGSGVHSFVQDESFHFISASKLKARDVALDAYYTLVEEYGVENVCFLSPMRQKGTCCTNVLNEIIQDKLNPLPFEEMPTYAKKNSQLRVGDRVMCNKNNWAKNIANGDVGTILSINPNCITVQFDSGETVDLTDGEQSTLSLAYAMTIHKSQGSEYKGVVIVFTTEHWFMRQRNLLYTAVTRAKEKLYLIGDARAIAACIDKNEAPHRNTKLKERLFS